MLLAAASLVAVEIWLVALVGEIGATAVLEARATPKVVAVFASFGAANKWFGAQRARMAGIPWGFLLAGLAILVGLRCVAGGVAAAPPEVPGFPRNAAHCAAAVGARMARR